MMPMMMLRHRNNFRSLAGRCRAQRVKCENILRKDVARGKIMKNDRLSEGLQSKKHHVVKIHFRADVEEGEARPVCASTPYTNQIPYTFLTTHCNEIIQEFCRVIERLICGATIAVSDRERGAPLRCFHEWANVFHNGSFIGLEWKVFLQWKLKSVRAPTEAAPLERKTINKFQFRFSTASTV